MGIYKMNIPMAVSCLTHTHGLHTCVMHLGMPIQGVASTKCFHGRIMAKAFC
jgi:hypothetical protein